MNIEHLEDLPEAVLRYSPTWIKYADASGMCSTCKEPTSVLSPCCGSSVHFEGGDLNFEDIWHEIAEELNFIDESAQSHFERKDEE